MCHFATLHPLENTILSRRVHRTGRNLWRGPTAAQLDAAKDKWKEHKASLEIYQATEKALIAQIIEAIDPIYLRAQQKHTTGQYANTIRNVLKHLFDTHGKITPQQVKTAELKVYNMQYDISQPVDVVFNAIEDLSKFAKHAEHASLPMSPQQLLTWRTLFLPSNQSFNKICAFGPKTAR